MTAVHGSPRDPIWEYITTPDIAAANLGAFETRVCLFGHTHQPAVFRSTDGRMEATLAMPGHDRHARRGRSIPPQPRERWATA